MTVSIRPDGYSITTFTPVGCLFNSRSCSEIKIPVLCNFGVHFIFIPYIFCFPVPFVPPFSESILPQLESQIVYYHMRYNSTHVK